MNGILCLQTGPSVGSTLNTKPSEIIQAGGQHFRISTWRAGSGAALITPLTAFELLESTAINVGIQKAQEMGYHTIYTSALHDHETAGFYKSGFILKEQLYMLQRPITSLSASVGKEIKLKKPTFEELLAVSELDSLCFDEFWTMNREGLLEAESATSRARFRIAVRSDKRPPEVIVGYAITGLGDKRGYLQRLAVHPDYQQQSIGRHLLADSLGWLRFWRASEILVNTQMRNDRALRFYINTGFTLLSERLNIMEFKVSSQN